MQKSESGAANGNGSLDSALTTPPESTSTQTLEKCSIPDRLEKELAFQSLLAKFHNAVWKEAERGGSFDLAGTSEAKALIAMFNGVPPLSEMEAVTLILDAHYTARNSKRVTGTSNWAGDIWHALKRGFSK